MHLAKICNLEHSFCNQTRDWKTHNNQGHADKGKEQRFQVAKQVQEHKQYRARCPIGILVHDLGPDALAVGCIPHFNQVVSQTVKSISLDFFHEFLVKFPLFFVRVFSQVREFLSFG